MPAAAWRGSDWATGAKPWPTPRMRSGWLTAHLHLRTVSHDQVQAEFNAARIYAQAVDFAAGEVGREGERAVALYRAYRSRAFELLEKTLRQIPDPARRKEILSDPAQAAPLSRRADSQLHGRTQPGGHGVHPLINDFPTPTYAETSRPGCAKTYAKRVAGIPRHLARPHRRRRGRMGVRRRVLFRLRPCLEVMEDRTLLTAFLVTNISDSGPGSLRQAILSANAATGSGDAIDFAIPGAGVHERSSRLRSCRRSPARS